MASTAPPTIQSVTAYIFEHILIAITCISSIIRCVLLDIFYPISAFIFGNYVIGRMVEDTFWIHGTLWYGRRTGPANRNMPDFEDTKSIVQTVAVIAIMVARLRMPREWTTWQRFFACTWGALVIASLYISVDFVVLLTAKGVACLMAWL
jgi:hypothetical protein